MLFRSVLDQVPAADDSTGAPGAPRTRPRIGLEGLLKAVNAEYQHGPEGLVERILRRVRTLHGGPLVDDAAVLIIGWPGRDADGAGLRSSTLADSVEWR